MPVRIVFIFNYLDFDNCVIHIIFVVTITRVRYKKDEDLIILIDTFIIR